MTRNKAGRRTRALLSHNTQTAIIRGLEKAKRRDWIKPHDIALAIQCELEKVVQLRNKDLSKTGEVVELSIQGYKIFKSEL